MASRCRPLLAALISLAGCCLGGDDYLTLGIGPGESRTVPPWGSATAYTLRDRPALEADQVPGHPLGGAVFEAFADDGATPVALACATRRIDNATRQGCGFSDQTICDLAALGPGRYVIVHRRAHGNGDPLNCAGACPWESFQGEAALRFALTLTP